MPETSYLLLVPIPGRAAYIKEASAIVGELQEHDGQKHYSVDFEGSKHMTFEDRLQHAAGRRKQAYPTIARAMFKESDLIPVGTVVHSDNLCGWTIESITDKTALLSWTPDAPPIGGSESFRSRAAGIKWSKLGAGKQFKLTARAQAGESLTDLILNEPLP